MRWKSRRVRTSRHSRRAALFVGVAGVTALIVQRRARPAGAQANTPLAGEPALPSLPDEDVLALNTIIEERLAVEEAPGAVAGFWMPGKGAWTHAAGVGNLQTDAPIAIDDHFRIASVTKTFTATVMLQLVDEGKLTLEDPLETYVPGIPNGTEITMRQLLGMTAGIYNYVTDADFGRAYVSDPLMPFDPQDAVAIIKRHEPDFPPGERVQYSDSNYILAGLIVEQLSGQSAGEAIAARIIEPLGLSGTSFPTTPAMPSPSAHGYAADPGSEQLRDLTESNPNVAWTAGAMISTLANLHVWGKALAEGALLSPETQRERLQIAPIATTPAYTLGYGLGIMEFNGFYGHNGAIFGYSTWLLHSLEHDATIVVLVNRGETETEFAGGIADDIGHYLFPAQFPRAAGTPNLATPAA